MTDAYELLEQLDSKAKLEGWQHILHDLSLNNELTDVKVVNFPEVDAYNIAS